MVFTVCMDILIQWPDDDRYLRSQLVSRREIFTKVELYMTENITVHLYAN